MGEHAWLTTRLIVYHKSFVVLGVAFSCIISPAIFGLFSLSNSGYMVKFLGKRFVSDSNGCCCVRAKQERVLIMSIYSKMAAVLVFFSQHSN